VDSAAAITLDFNSNTMQLPNIHTHTYWAPNKTRCECGAWLCIFWQNESIPSVNHATCFIVLRPTSAICTRACSHFLWTASRIHKFQTLHERVSALLAASNLNIAHTENCISRSPRRLLHFL